MLTDNPARGGDPVADTRQVLDLVFLWGIMIQHSETDDIPVNSALVHRTTRQLERAVKSLRNGRRPLDGGDPEALANSLEANIHALQNEL